eukprot:UN23613
METDEMSVHVLENPLLNKGTAFSMGERDRLGIRGLIPPRVFSDSEKAIQHQMMRVQKSLDSQTSDVAKHYVLANLQDRNEILFYRMLKDNIVDLAPLIYTPVVGDACIQFGNRYTKPRGMYFSTYDRGHFDSMCYNWPADDVQVIVVTDGSRILGLGDLGANGMGIPIGKLSLYVACGGIHPSRTLPITLDLGTNNPALLDDPLYLGVRRQRLEGDEYDEAVDEFMRAIHHRWPYALIQFEDFSTNNAARILETYRDRVMCFNDDIQGTGVTALSGILAGLKAIGQLDRNDLLKQRIFVVGAGSAGCGIAQTVLDGLKFRGLKEDE